MSSTDDEDDSGFVAVTAIAGRFPGAPDVETFWDNLCNGRESVSVLHDQLEEAEDGYVPSYGLLSGPELFDADYFDYSAEDALITDPQHRLLLECAHEALERAGHGGPERLSTGVFVGGSVTDHSAHVRAWGRGRGVPVQESRVQQGNDLDFLATRIAYKLDLTGPAMAVQSACSSSLVAVHVAIGSLLAGDCAMAVAGGASVLAAIPTLQHDPDDIFADDGRCRPFDARGRGAVRASAVGLVVLRPLAEALADGDHVHAVIRGTAVNNDGRHKMGFHAPSVAGPAGAVRTAQLVAGVDADEIGYVEAHGTGTAIGDAIEVRALSEAFGPGAPERCVLGSVKSNIGHTDAAAGVLGLIKVVLSLRHGLIPGTAHFRRPNPHLDLPAGPFVVTSEATPWPPGEGPRRAGVNSTGIGGTNAHLVVEEAPPAPLPPDDGRHHLLPLSARTAPAIAESAARLSVRLQRDPVALANAAWTLQTGRAAFAHRAFVVCSDRDDAVRALTALTKPAERPQAPADPATGTPHVAFLFPGHGGPQVGTARELYAHEPVFRAAVDDCAARAGAELGVDLRQVLYPEPGTEADAAARLTTTAVGQAALFAVQHAMAELWGARGVHPHTVLGHGLGGFVAAVSAEVLTWADALSLVLTRGRLLDRIPEGAVVPDDIDAEYADAVASVQLRAPRLPWISDRTGMPVTARDACDPAFWAGDLRHTDRVSDAVQTLLAGSAGILLDVGPGGVLGSLVRQHPDHGPGATIVESLPDGAGGAAESLHATGVLWQAGLPVRWSALHEGREPRRVPLPTYPFHRERFALEAPTPDAAPAEPAPGPDADRAMTDPRTPVEKAIADVWREVLRVPHVGIDDDFFELGGQSLHATRVLTRLGQALGPDAPRLTVMDVFDHSTIRELAALVGGSDPQEGVGPSAI